MIIEEIQVPTIYVAGDSTVADQSAAYPYVPGAAYCGWASMLPCYINGEIALSNHAQSGLTTQSFWEEGHYSIIKDNIKSGDYFFLQFGHNDQKIQHLDALWRVYGGAYTLCCTNAGNRCNTNYYYSYSAKYMAGK